MKYSCKFTLQPHDVDFSKHLSPNNLGSYLLDTAGLAANAHGFGMEYMNKADAAWVLSRFSVTIYNMPVEYETIVVHTWIRACNSIFSKRLFSVTDEKGNVLVEADSLWSIINITTRKAENLMLFSDLSTFVVEQEINMLPTSKVPKENIADASLHSHLIAYSDIDMNLHVNSMKYLQWALDTFPLDHYRENILLRYDINFLKEMKSADSANILRSDNEKLSIFNITNEDKIPCCRVKFTWK